jgi:cyclase
VQITASNMPGAAGRCAAVVALAMLSVSALAQHQRLPVPPDRLPQVEQRGMFLHPAPDEVGVLPVQGNVYLLNLGAMNITAQVGQDGILLVDTGPEEWAERVVATLRERFGDRPIHYIVNTHIHSGSTGGNAIIREAAGTNPRVIAHENTYNRMLGIYEGETEFPDEMLPNATFYTLRKTIYYNGEPIEILHVPNAHTDGDVMVWFRGSDVLSVGNLYSTVSYPLFDEARGASMQGHLDALNRILGITVSAYNLMDGTRVIPGHGRLSNMADLNGYRNYMTIIRDRVEDMVREGRSLDEIRAARPTLEYDGLYNHPEWTTDMFLDALYRDLSGTGGR